MKTLNEVSAESIRRGNAYGIRRMLERLSQEQFTEKFVINQLRTELEWAQRSFAELRTAEALDSLNCAQLLAWSLED